MKLSFRFFLMIAMLSLCLQSCALAALKVGSTQKGKASWYGDSHQGQKTASGEKFDMDAMTAAHRTLPFQSLVKVKSLSSGKSVTVKITDRGPYSKGRIIDVSKAAAEKLGILDKGVDQVEIEVISIPAQP
jgi:rare lipoprotein A